MRLVAALILVIALNLGVQARHPARVNYSPFHLNGSTFSTTLFLQIELQSDSSGIQGTAGVLCMAAKARARSFSRMSWIAATVLAFLIYYLWLLLLPRFLSSGGKWLISPILASLVVAGLVAAIENSYLTQACEEPSGWRFDTMSTIFLINWLFVVLLIFSALAGLRYFRLRRRMAALKTS